MRAHVRLAINAVRVWQPSARVLGFVCARSGHVQKEGAGRGETGRRRPRWAELPGRHWSGAAAMRRPPCERCPPGKQGLFSEREQGEVTGLSVPRAPTRTPQRLTPGLHAGGCATTFVPQALADPPSSASMRPSQTGTVNIFEKKVGQGGGQAAGTWCGGPGDQAQALRSSREGAKHSTWDHLGLTALCPQTSHSRLAQLCCPFHGSVG